ncbi:hypothetical protein OPV22_030082 [Ensete ventricosum]|uniref:C3H1-type domain-containing protein n=1 Tax=Ensete ventricosum TaxID=4639 RepID=A0AAV8Q7Z3_ENSVE|nr:hypothetical protein OPV22_030082 [Ensete ventricosum]
MNEPGSAAKGPRPVPDAALEESMWRLGLGEGSSPYPERPGEPDCSYYVRTGSCNYGERCRYNHPRDRGALTGVGTGRTGAVEYLERVGQPVCEYYIKTGTCKFGSTCKYRHPRQGSGSIPPVLLNDCGYPLRPGEKECSYYMKTGHLQPLSIPSPQQYPPPVTWQFTRPSVFPGSYMPGPYAPMLLSSGVVPVQGWNPYPVPMSSVVSHGGHQAVQAGQVSGLPNQAFPLMPAYSGPLTPVSSSVGPSNASRRGDKFPERPGQPECQFYMRTGDCKFGATCKYHHPPDWSISKGNCVLSPLGLPHRPGAQLCNYYAQHGMCKFGTTCKFDHPMGTLSCSPSASSLSDMPVSPFPIGLSVATFAPSSSSSELHPEFSSMQSNSLQLHDDQPSVQFRQHHNGILTAKPQSLSKKS